MKKEIVSYFSLWEKRKILLILKLSTILIVVFTLNLSANGFGQFSFSAEGKKISEVFKVIENQSNYRFSYNHDIESHDKIIDFKADNNSINQVLDKIFESTDFSYKILENNLIVVSLNENLQQGTIKGTVTDENGNILPGVTVLVKGTTVGTLTDLSGKYIINGAPQDAVLLFSFIGMATQEIPSNGQMVIDVVLKEAAIGLEEVVVTGYTGQRKKDIIGAVSVADMKTIKSIATGSGVVALQGQVPGLNIISNGSPGSVSQIYIRGLSSFGQNRPLVLVDGVAEDLDQINSSDIESVQVLKDAGAAAIYGVNGSNGVIIVTTKKGKAGAPVVTYDSYTGVQMPISGNPFNLMNSEDWWNLQVATRPSEYSGTMPDYMYRAPGGVRSWAFEGDPAVDPSKYVFDPGNSNNNYIIGKVNKSGTNWFQESFKPAWRTNQTLSVSGGTEKGRYLFSLNYLNENGTLIETYLKSYSARLNTDFNVGKHIRIGENVNLFYYTNNGYQNTGEGTVINRIVSMIPLTPVQDISGIQYWGTFATPTVGNNSVNPVYIQKTLYNNRNNNIVIRGNVYADVDFLKHFTARTSFGGSTTNSYNVNFTPVNYTDATSYASPNSLGESSSYDLYEIWTNTLKYDNTFGKHKLTVLAGSEYIHYLGRSLYGSRQDFFLSDFSYLVLPNGQKQITNSSGAYENALFSLFGRLDYSYSDKYLLGVTVRRDGSSKFGADSRYGVFPSVSLGWRLSQEAFMENISWINDLKIRASYGSLGSQSNVDNANAFTLFGTSLYSSYYNITGQANTNTPGYYPSRFGNSNTGWEKDIISNIGIDATILNNKLELSAEIYKKAISGLLFPQPLPATAGGATPPSINIGDVNNKGFELAANYRGSITNDLNFTIGGNINHYVNKIVSIPGASYFDVSSDARFGVYQRNEVGHSIGEFYGYKIEGLFQSDADVTASPTQQDAQPGVFKYTDLNGAGYEDGKPDGKIDPNDRTFLGNPNPKFTYGINLGLDYKNFDFLMNFYGSYGNKVMNEVKSYTYFSYFRWAVNNNILNQWSPENTSSNVPKYLSSSSFSENSAMNSFLIEDGSFLKCRSLILGYTLPASVVEKVKIHKLRVYVQIMNLFQITKYTGLDPEIPGTSQTFGVDLGNYPNNQKQYLFGVNLSF